MEVLDNIRASIQVASESGPDCWVTFKANRKEHWLLCTLTQIRMDWPFSSPPSESENLKLCFGAGEPVQIHAWDIDTYATFTPAVRDVDSLIRGIDSAFQDLYRLGADYALTYKVENA